ncbi:MAG: hypothetical protein IKS02_05300, partial [Fibrobacter sp.]|nr:hypothetical protein [Fibrobacter sp.]
IPQTEHALFNLREGLFFLYFTKHGLPQTSGTRGVILSEARQGVAEGSRLALTTWTLNFRR